MNKNLILISFVAFLSNPIFSQPIISGAELTPVIGEVFLIHYCDSVNEGPAGMNQTWDFSSSFCPGPFALHIAGSTGSSMPAASFVQVVGIDSGFYSTTSSATEFIANSDPTSGYTTLVNPLKTLSFPITYGSVMSDTFQFNPYFVSTINHYKSGRMNYIVDGYGTLILPSGTFSDVLRIKQTVITKDSIPGSASIDSTVTIGWIKAGNHNSIAWVSKRYMIGATVPYPANFYYLDNIVTTLDENNIDYEKAITLSPNPASNNIQLTFSQIMDIKEIKMLDIFGGEIQIEVNRSSALEYILSTSQKLNGIFFIKISDNKTVFCTKKIQFAN